MLTDFTAEFAEVAENYENLYPLCVLRVLCGEKLPRFAA